MASYIGCRRPDWVRVSRLQVSNVLKHGASNKRDADFVAQRRGISGQTPRDGRLLKLRPNGIFLAPFEQGEIAVQRLPAAGA